VTRPITIRPPLPDDQGYIAATWARSMISADRAGHAMRRHGPARGTQSERDRRATLGGRIDAVLDHPQTRGLVAVWPGAERDYIVGWVLYAEGGAVPVVHYAYVRAHDDAGESLRGHGIARELLRRLGITRHRAVICTSDGPSSEDMRGHYLASWHMPLAEFLGNKEKR
jgi:hypothetical protein